MLGGAAVVSILIGVAVFRLGGDNAPEIGRVTDGIATPSVPAAATRATGEAVATGTEDEIPQTTQSVTQSQAGTDGQNSDGAITSEKDEAVSATVIGEDIVARADPDGGIGIEVTPLAKPKVGVGAQSGAAPSLLTLDLVRVDKAGAVVIAGKAPAGQLVTIELDGETIAKVQADTHGAFVALFDLPPSSAPYVLTMLGTDAAGVQTRSDKRVVIAAREVLQPNVATDTPAELPTDEAPAVIITSDEGVKVAQPAIIGNTAPEVMDNVTLDLISYDSEGEVVLTGRSTPDQFVRVYVNDKPVKTETVAEDGTWQISLPEVEAGRYTLRVDEIDDAGQVASRVETPFQKEFAQDVKRVASSGDLGASQSSGNLPTIQKVTIQPGATLWALAEANYGEGDLYMQIFNANKDFIRDPDLIYPGQIFTIPE